MVFIFVGTAMYGSDTSDMGSSRYIHCFQIQVVEGGSAGKLPRHIRLERYAKPAEIEGNPAFQRLVTIAPGHHMLYSVDETDAWRSDDGKPANAGAVHAFAVTATAKVEAQKMPLRSDALLGQAWAKAAPDGDDDPPPLVAVGEPQASGGGHPCNLAVAPGGAGGPAPARSLVVANYSGGSVSLLPLDDVGALGAAVSTVAHEGSSSLLVPALADRQEAPHCHCAAVHPTCAAPQCVAVCDLGLDIVFAYDIVGGAVLRGGARDPASDRHLVLPVGSGPRHMAWHPNGRVAYVVNELTATLAVAAFDPAARAFAPAPLQLLPLLPPAFEGGASRDHHQGSADVHLHPSGRWLYASSRTPKPGVITVFAVSDDGALDGARLEVVQHISTRGDIPRNFAISRDGSLLLVANQDSYNLVAFSIDHHAGDDATGQLTYCGEHSLTPLDGKPTCVTFYDGDDD